MTERGVPTNGKNHTPESIELSRSSFAMPYRKVVSLPSQRVISIIVKGFVQISVSLHLSYCVGPYTRERWSPRLFLPPTRTTKKLSREGWIVGKARSIRFVSLSGRLEETKKQVAAAAHTMQAVHGGREKVAWSFCFKC